MIAMNWTQDTTPGARDRPGTDEAGDAMTKLKDLKARFMEDSAFREEYARIDEEYALIEALVRARTRAGRRARTQRLLPEESHGS